MEQKYLELNTLYDAFLEDLAIAARQLVLSEDAQERSLGKSILSNSYHETKARKGIDFKKHGHLQNDCRAIDNLKYS